jgi:hypothetical protein
LYQLLLELLLELLELLLELLQLEPLLEPLMLGFYMKLLLLKQLRKIQKELFSFFLI